jgi:hypothetical protein
MPCVDEPGQPYMITIVPEHRSMRNSCLWLGTTSPGSLPFSVGRGRIGNALSGQRGAREFVKTNAAFAVLNR